MKTAEQWYAQGGLNNDAAEIQHRRDIQADALRLREAVACKELPDIVERLKTQDNRCTMNPMFCVQIKVRDVGYDSNYSDNPCWYRNTGGDPEVVYDKEPDGADWEKFGYKDRWETVMVAFTEKGCEEYLDLNGHNDRRLAHNGEVRIYVESFNRCPEMIAIREALMSNT